MPRGKRSGGATKADLIRAAITELGGPDSAKNADVVAAVANKGATTSGNEVSMYKTKMRKTAGSKSTRGKRGRAAALAPAGGVIVGNGLRVDDFVSLGTLIKRVGKEKVRAALELLD